MTALREHVTNAARATAFIDARCRWEDHGHGTPCFVWHGALSKGYARANYSSRMWRIHRLAYIVHVGAIPEGLTLDHLCRVKNCCNPAHLEPVTAAENSRRAAPFQEYSGRRRPDRKTHCKCGVELTAEIRAKGKAVCKPCWTAYMLAWNRRHPEALLRPKRPPSPEQRAAYNVRRREMRAAGMWKR